MAKYNFAKFEVQFLNHENATEVQVGLIPALTFQEAVARLAEYYGEDLISVTVELLNYEDVPITYEEIIDIFEEEELISAQEFNSYPIN